MALARTNNQTQEIHDAALTPENFPGGIVEFTEYLHNLATHGERGADEAEHALNGAAYQVIRSDLSVSDRRVAGVFFTGDKLADKAVRLIAGKLQKGATACDPTCGAGDLLVAAAKHLPTAPTLKETISLWGRKLSGLDLNPDFVRMAKFRLILLARLRTGDMKSRISTTRAFPKIRVANVYDSFGPLSRSQIILLNPPYCCRVLSTRKVWSSGKTSEAALIMALVAKSAAIDADLVCILPEVLRGGTRYERWRKEVSMHLRGIRTESVGLFDKWTDVDVFVAHLKRESGTDNYLWMEDELQQETSKSTSVLGQYFEVRVGPVVPHRHEEIGESHPYAIVGNLPSWQEVVLTDRIRFSGSLFLPPFVAVRRTSRPGDKHRMVPCMILGDEEVAVENHLICLKPSTGQGETCRKLMQYLRNSDVTEHLDKTLRCRHLTVRSIKNLPVPEALFD